MITICASDFLERLENKFSDSRFEAVAKGFVWQNELAYRRGLVWAFNSGMNFNDDVDDDCDNIEADVTKIKVTLEKIIQR